MTAAADILIAGAGPAGLALALQAHDHGASVRIVDRRPQADRPSRALVLHARTLEVLRPLGVTQALLARADSAPQADLQLGSRVIRVTLADLALPDTAFPHLSLIRQTDVEQVLAQALADRGVEVERGTELVSVPAGHLARLAQSREWIVSYGLRPGRPVATGGYALASDPLHVHGWWGWLGRFAGDVRIRVTATRPGRPVFVAIGPTGDVSRYLLSGAALARGRKFRLAPALRAHGQPVPSWMALMSSSRAAMTR